jgi:hypothetical protein
MRVHRAQLALGRVDLFKVQPFVVSGDSVSLKILKEGFDLVDLLRRKKPVHHAVALLVELRDFFRREMSNRISNGRSIHAETITKPLKKENGQSTFLYGLFCYHELRVATHYPQRRIEDDCL